MATTATAPIAIEFSGPPSPVHDAPAYSESAAEPGQQLTQVLTSSSRRSSASTVPSRPSLTRRTSLEEDYFYREVMTVEKRPTEPPPSYETTMKKIRRKERQEAAAAAAAMAAETTTAVAAEAAAASKSDVSETTPPSPTPVLSSTKGKETASSRPTASKSKSRSKSAPAPAPLSNSGAVHTNTPDDVLPPYSCDIHIEGVFQRKMEIENATKRAEDRRWATSYVVLHGTSLEIHQCRKDRSWAGRTTRTGPGVSPDRPPWMHKAGLERRYNLSYADVGIAADYVKRRYVIRVRAETDQFLLSCVELETFIQWLDALFAALSIAAPIDERDFPRDQSIPRLQRIRWYRGRDREAEANQDRERDEDRGRESERETDQESDRDSDRDSGRETRQQLVGGSASGDSSADDEAADVISALPSPSLSRPISPSRLPSKSVRTGQSLAAAAAAVLEEESRRVMGAAPITAAGAAASAPRVGLGSTNASSISLATASSASTVAGPSTAPLHNLTAQQQAASRAMLSQGNPVPDNNVQGKNGGTGGRFSLRSIRSRLNLGGGQGGGGSSNSSNSNSNNNNTNSAGRMMNAPAGFRHHAVDATTGKWQPSHRWTKTHDMVYAKLCYATLLFRSPRKSNYIVMRGKQWLVDWSTGNMVRVSPPRYGEIETQPGPFQVLRTENTRI
ncbi:uncharacterized protein SPSK_05045 [Sporothrix schenckii 1099-18]|uniref:PH domain-containing protein n=1 Tax=Sporothrix schenckii 1099-18 TaxID=1397361 RepID=A0A0F2LU77_SPOSC|nr:uncharacterized protein SPSK_05045 [Sporothrix schenckii 1099-18]KJR81007.1 hypothetical protein SPSK_05045 [Sporothrix schenckii 1099-18]